MIDKNAQRARVAQFEMEQLAQGKTMPVLPAIKPMTPKPAVGVTVSSTPAYNGALNKKAADYIGVAKKAKYVRKAKGRLAEPFTNSIGQVINVGDSVVAISQGYNKSIKVRVATYVGLRKDNAGRVTSVTVTGMMTYDKYVSGKGYVKVTEVKTSSLPSKRIFKS